MIHLKDGRVLEGAMAALNEKAVNWTLPDGEGNAAIPLDQIDFIELPEPPPEPPYDIAIGKLVSLKTRDLPGKGRYKQYYIELSEIIKHYIQGRFEIIAVEATTYEIKRDLKHPELPRDKAEMIISLLTRSDLIKFAKQMPKPEAPVEDYNIARLFVTSTKPVVIIADNQTSPAEVSR